MRILDEQSNEIALEDVDFTLGYLKDEELVTHYSEQTHYEPGCFYFEDKSSYSPTGLDDPRIEVVVPGRQYRYIPQEGEEEKEIRGIDIKLVIDQTAHDEIEQIQRYILYTKEELVQRALPDRVTNIEATLEEDDTTIEDLILLLAEVLGGEEEEEELL